MKLRALSLGAALTLSLLALAASGPARAAGCPSNFCAEAKEECFSGCNCALFDCDPVGCWSTCACPIICLD